VGILVAIAVAVLMGCSHEPPLKNLEKWTNLIETLTPLHEKLGEPRPGDWLDSKSEDGQTFAEYRRCAPIRPRGKRDVIYVQPLGPMTENQAKIVRQTAEFMRVYFHTKTTVLDSLPLSLVPGSARRGSRGFGTQLLTGHVRMKILRPRLPRDGAAIIAFTALDLWPGEGWNFVFGEASLRDRVAVWSLARNGNPDESQVNYRKCLLRTVKTATHETGHMFSIQHCTAFECNMCGSMSQQESDRHPLALCPHCVAKICWACEAEPSERYQELADICKLFGLAQEEKRYRALRRAVRSAK